MTEKSKIVSGRVSACRRGSMAAFTTFALVGGGVVCGVAQANTASATVEVPPVEYSRKLFAKNVDGEVGGPTSSSRGTASFPKTTN